jgi:hypothetical protein
VRSDNNLLAVDPSGIMLFAMNALLACWAAYAIFMTIALPNDWIRERVRLGSFLCAQLLFVFGVSMTVVIALTGFVAYVLRAFASSPLYPLVVGITLSASSFAFALLFLDFENFSPRKP